jgi:2-polyprenyl-6-methoxyphenol hydroxylase-like FAD-dependent oxidoreductase
MTDPVLIVGAGPTGLTATLELSRLGIAVRLIEKAPKPRRRRAPSACRRGPWN